MPWYKQTRFVLSGVALSVIVLIFSYSAGANSDSSDANGGGSASAALLVAGQSVLFGTADVTMTRTASRAPRAYVHFEMVSKADGGICPNADDIYLVTSAGRRVSLVEAPDNCTALNVGEKGEAVFASAPMTGAGLWPKGAMFVFAPGQGPVVGRWAVDGTAAASRE